MYADWVYGVSGSPQLPGGACFRAHCSAQFHSTVHQACPPGFSLPIRVASSELLRLRLRPPPFGAGDLPGFVPSSRHHRRASTLSREASNPRYVPSPGVRSLSTVFSALRLRGLFHPRAASRARLRSGASPSAQQERFVTALCPLAVRLHHARRAASRPARPPDVASAPRLCSTRRCVRSGSGISLPGRRSPLRVQLLQALHLSGRRRLTRRPPLMALSRFDLRLRAGRDPPPSAYHPREARWFCLQTHLPARAFGPAV